MVLNYKQKYLKYKLKYLTTKKLYGGMVPTDNPGDHFKRIMEDKSNISVEFRSIGAFHTNLLKEELSKNIKNIIEEEKRDFLKNNQVINNKTFDYTDLHGDIANLLIDIYYDGNAENGNKIKNYLKNYCGKKDSDLIINNVDDFIKIAIEYLNCVSTNFMEHTWLDGDSPRSSVSPSSYN